MGTVELVVRLVVALVVIGIVTAAYRSADHAVSEHYVAPVRAELEAKVKEQSDRADANEATNASLRASIGGAEGKVKQCNDRVDDLLKNSADNLKLSADALAALRAKSGQDDKRIEQLVKNASTPTQGDFCEQARKADSTLSDLARRQRLRHPAAATDPSR